MSVHGRFLWYDLMTTDLEASLAFYTKVLPWTLTPFGDGPTPYQMFTAGERPVAGSVALEAPGVPTHWIAYIGTDDLDATIRQAKELGGAIAAPPRAMPSVGRFAVLTDPEGAAFGVIQPVSDDPVAPEALGDVSWRELMAVAPDAARAFYVALFGWVETGTMDMPTGPYWMFGQGPTKSLGGIMGKPAPVPVPHWTYYVNVESVEATAAAIREAGGQVVNGPMPIPDGVIANCLDPQFGSFSIYEETDPDTVPTEVNE